MITTQLPNGSPMNLQGFATAAIPNVLVPQVFAEEEDRAFVAQCCYNNLTLAGGSEPFQNDIKAVLFKVFNVADTIDFFLEKETVEVAALNDNTLGTFFPIGSFPTQPLLAGFKLEWEKVLAAHGEGNYKIRIERNLIIGNDIIFTINYNLKTFTAELADETIWIEWIHNGEIIDELDYTGIDWFQSIRLPGFFGNKQTEFEEEIFKDSNFQTFQIRNELTFPRLVEIGPVPSCVSDFLTNLVQANIIQITDYNLRNHDYFLQQKVVRLSEINETTYDRERLAVYNLTFTDRKEDHIKINC